MKCPNCSYLRGAEENVPDWQCPSCGIAYNKFVVNHAELEAKKIEYLNKCKNEESFTSSFNKYLISILFLCMLIGIAKSNIISFLGLCLISLFLLLLARKMVVTEHFYGSMRRLFHKSESPLMFKIEVCGAYILAGGSFFAGIKYIL